MDSTTLVTSGCFCRMAYACADTCAVWLSNTPGGNSIFKVAEERSALGVNVFGINDRPAIDSAKNSNPNSIVLPRCCTDQRSARKYHSIVGPSAVLSLACGLSV